MGSNTVAYVVIKDDDEVVFASSEVVPSFQPSSSPEPFLREASTPYPSPSKQCSIISGVIHSRHDLLYICTYILRMCLNTYVRTYMYVHMLTCVVVHMLSVCSCSVIPAEDYLVAFHNPTQ